jgi:hypothetical protein
MRQHPEFQNQISDMSSTPLGGALSGDTGLAAEIFKQTKK